ncbi:hypothetical protein OAD62_01900 [Oceanihabitans sp.]|nr:hypothetical protein [Oceanihabitans sp.]
MSNKKHIDRVFQEKLKDFEESPSSKVWQNIKGELEQSDDDRKVFPIWLRLAGVAAILLILLTIGNAVVSESGVSNNDKIVDTENILNTPINQTNNLNNNTNVDELQKASQDEVLTNVNALDLNSAAYNDASKNTNLTTSESSKLETHILNNKDAVADSNSSDINSVSEDKNTDYATTPKTEKSHSNTVSQRNTVDATNQIPHAVAQNTTLLNTSSEKENKDNIAVGAVNSIVTSAQKTTEGVTQNKAPINKALENTAKSAIPNNSNISNTASTPTITEGIAQNNSGNKKNNSSIIPELDKDKAEAVIKNSTQDAVAEQQSNSEEKEENLTTDEETDKDSPSIEEAIAKAEDLIEEEEKVNRWQVYANIAPVYYNTLGQGSHIDDQFVQNSKSGEINMSYGVNVSYVLNDKLKLRSGLNSLDLSYDTDNVILYENVSNNSNSAPRNLNLSSSGQSFSAISATNLGAQQVGSGIGGNANAAISQRIAYYEVPLELEYNLVDNKFGVNVIGGVSTFILNDNAVYSEFDGFKTEIGEANNINDVSFSGNLGLGLDYKFSDKIKLNVQPTFKYQLNAYKNTSGDFRPYIVGIYTGLSYKF